MSVGKHRAPEPEEPTIGDVIHKRYVLSVRDQLILLAIAFALLVGTIMGVQALFGWS